MSISPPIDVIYDDRYVEEAHNRYALEKLTETEDPFLLTLAPICGPWSSWQHVNMAKDEFTKEKILEQRKEWYPVLQWMARIIRSRLAKGREVLVENPWPSLIWQLRCLEDIINEPTYNAVTDEPVELLRIDQCMHSLAEEQSGLPHQKATGLMLSSRKMIYFNHDVSEVIGINSWKAATGRRRISNGRKHFASASSWVLLRR